MRDILSDLSDAMSDPDPVRRAQIQMKRPLPKRFYKDVSTDETQEGFRILLDGRPVRQYLGVVNGEAIIGANLFKDMFASIRNVVGGRAGSYERTLADARRIAMGEMQEEAQKLGANAVIGVDVDYEVLGADNGMLMVCVSGTAVQL